MYSENVMASSPGTLISDTQNVSLPDLINKGIAYAIIVAGFLSVVFIFIGGISFILSGGQEDEEATIRLNAMHQMGPLPWPLTFSYGRAIQNGALQSWAKNPDDISGAQALLLGAAEQNSKASVGEYK